MGLLSTFASLGGSSVGTGVVDLQLNTASFDRGLTTSQAKLKTTTGLMGGNISRLSQLTTAGVAGIAAGVGIAAVATVNAASDQEEALNKVNVVFGNLSDTVTKFADTSAESFGISKTAALQAAGGFGQMLQTAGLAQDEAAEMSVALVKLAGDLSSFNNIPTDEALEKLRSGLAGEAEPLRTMGVFLSEARVEQEAFASGIAKTGEKLTEAQKVQARYNLILQDSKLAQGDFGRTADSAANQQKALQAKVADLAAEIGKSLLPAFTALLGLASEIVDKMEPVLDVLARFLEITTELGNTPFAVKLIESFTGIGVGAYGAANALREVGGIVENELIPWVESGRISVAEAEEAIRKLGMSSGVSEDAIKEWIGQVQLAGFNSHDYTRALTGSREAMGRLSRDSRGAGRAIQQFAGMSAEATTEWKTETKTNLRDVSLSLDGLSEDWRQTATQTIGAARRMARNAAVIAEDLDKLADIRAPAEFKKWLVDQGPGWVSGYVRATREGKNDIEGYWRDASRSVRDQKDALDDVITKVDRVGQKVKDLPDQKTIDIRLNVTGVSDTEAGQHIADSLANEWVRGGG